MGEADSTVLDFDVLCPGCGYNLRGLCGPVVRCPECGRHWSVAQMLHESRAGVSLKPVLRPVAWGGLMLMGAVSLMVLMVLAGWWGFEPAGVGLLGVMAMVSGVIGAGLGLQAWRLWPTGVSGWWLVAGQGAVLIVMVGTFSLAAGLLSGVGVALVVLLEGTRDRLELMIGVLLTVMAVVFGVLVLWAGQALWMAMARRVAWGMRE